MKIAICDDEIKYIKDAEKHLNQYFSEHGLSFTLFKYNNGADLLNANIEFDIVFLDIEMPEINGIELGRKLQESNPDLVLIYITAYDHYLDDALDLGITRFFNKPIDSERFYKGLDRAIEKLNQTKTEIRIKDLDDCVDTIKINEIIFLEIAQRKTKIVTKNKTYYSKSSLNVWRERLNQSYFESPHNSYIVNTNHITRFGKDHIILDRIHTVPIAYRKKTEFKKKFMMLLEE